MKLLLTGGTGFVGESFLNYNSNFDIRLFSRSKPERDIEWVKGDLRNEESFAHAMKHVTHVVHLAARAHIMNETSLYPLDEYRKVNTEATLRLALAAARAGVSRFIYISSIKVHGESNHNASPITEEMQLEPVDPYGISKLDAEEGLRKISKETGLDVVIIRPPLIYGPGVKANFENLMKWLARGFPLPLGAVDNKRSLVGVNNLCNFINTCVEHPLAANEAFLISDQEDVSTSSLISSLKYSLKSSSVLIPVPVNLMKFGAYLIGKQVVAQRLFENLYVSSNKATEILDWKPRYSLQSQLDLTAEYFLRYKRVHNND